MLFPFHFGVVVCPSVEADRAHVALTVDPADRGLLFELLEPRFQPGGSSCCPRQLVEAPVRPVRSMPLVT